MEPERPPTPLGHPDRIPTPPGQIRFPTPRGYRRVRDPNHDAGYQQFCWHGPIGHHGYPGNRLLIPGHSNLISIATRTEPCEPLDFERERDKTPEKDPNPPSGCEAEKAMIESLQRRVEELETGVATRTNTINTLRVQNETLTNKNEALQADIDNRVTTINGRNATITALQDQVNAQTTINDDLTNQVTALNQEVTDLRAQVAALAAALPRPFQAYQYPDDTDFPLALRNLPEAGQVPADTTPQDWVRVEGWLPNHCQSGVVKNLNTQCRHLKSDPFAYCRLHCQKGPNLR